jgi:hypothetical protein
MPVYYDGIYTELSNLRENSYRSLGLVVAIMLVSRGVYAQLIALVEFFLIAANAWIAWHWAERGEVIFAVYYTQLQFGAYAAELAIIGIAGIVGALMIGADNDDYYNINLPRTRWRDYRAVRN